MSREETVYLDDMDGFAFEKLCQRIFDRSGHGRVERLGSVADGGRDLIITHPDGQKTIVECKHHPKSSVGRPIVQKLHSAVITSGATTGIVATTGRFTKEALEYAKGLADGTTMHLYDMHRLVDLAQKAQIRLITGGKDTAIYCHPVCGVRQIEDAQSEILAKFQSHPKSASDLAHISYRVTLVAHYAVAVDVVQDFTTSVGLIHSIRKHDVRCLLDAKTGEMIDENTASFLGDSATPGIPETEYPHTRTDFVLGVTGLKEKVVRQIADRYTVLARYRGRNRRQYKKVCRPGPKAIRINDIRHVLVPTYDLSIGILDARYSYGFISNNDSTMRLATDLHVCRVCSKKIEGAALLCNACGNVSHAPKFFGSHSHACKECKKTVCRNCTYWKRRALFFKKMLCKECAGPDGKRLA